MIRRAGPAASIAAMLATACGGSSPSAPGPSGGPTTTTFSGTARSSGPNSCGGDTLDLNAGDGEASVTLVQSTPSTPLLVQLCSPTATNHVNDCTINRATIQVGQTLRGRVIGGRTQVLALNPADCGNGQPPQFTSIAYTVSVVYPR
jgi:hypothetical protein